MGSAFRKQRRNQREVNVANRSAILRGCYATNSPCSAIDSSQMLIAPESLISFNNNSTSRSDVRSMDIKLKDEVDQGNEAVSPESHSSVEEEFDIEKIVFSSSCDSISLLCSPIFGTITNTSSVTYQTFEPTPLTQVFSQLYLGTEQDAQQAEKLIGLGITHIISLVGGGRYEDFYPKHMYIPLRDNGSSNLLEKLDNAYEFMLESQEPDNKLFIHCQLGQNRSASIVIGFLMKSRNLSLHEAYTLLKEKRQIIHPHKNYIEQLRQLDFELHKVYSTPRNFLDIALCSTTQEIKINHLNFSKADSKKFIRRQIINFKEDEEYSSSLPSLLF